jgi:tyrosine-protein phosphatase SIW14
MRVEEACSPPMRPALLLILAAALLPAAELRTRPATWAQPVLSVGGREPPVENWHVVDARVQRSAQPDRAGMRAATAAGIRTVLSLRAWHDDEDEARGTGLHLVRIPMDAGEITEAQLILAVQAIRTASGPVLVHCWHGSDRTGAVVAAWRIAAQGWTPAAAAEELADGGYGHHEDWFPNIVALVRGIDPVRFRRDTGFAD